MAHCGADRAGDRRGDAKRERFLEELAQLGKNAGRPSIIELARNAKALPGVAGDFVPLESAVVIYGGQAVTSALTTPNRKRVTETRPPMRVRVADVQAWHVGNVFEEAR